MLLCLLGYANLRLQNPIIFRSFLSNFLQNIADSVTRMYAVKLTLIYLVASARASSYDNDPRFVAVCDNSSMHLNVEFVSPFHGLIYTSGNAFQPECSFPTSPLLNNTQLKLTLPFSTCSFVGNYLDNETISISSTIIVQQHRMMPTSYDIIRNVTCELSHPMDTFRQWYNTTSTADNLNSSLLPAPGVSTWIETVIGSDLLPEADSEVGTELFFVVNVRDGGKNRDMSVRNCIAHDGEVLTNETRLYQMSDIFGCPNTSYALSNFTVSNQTEGPANLMAYTQMRNLVYTVQGEFFVTCGVVLCENSCQNLCEEGAIPTMHSLCSITVKKFVGRLPDATLPPSLDLFESSQRISKRSFSDIFTRWLSFGSSLLELKEDTFQKENHTMEYTETPLEEPRGNVTDALYTTPILKDHSMEYTETPLEEPRGNVPDVLYITPILKDHTIEYTETPLEELRGNVTDALYITPILKDFEFHISDDSSAISKITLRNETKLSSFEHNFKIWKYSILPEFTVCVLFLLLVGCYGGLLYTNSKKNLRNAASRNNFMTELYTIVH